MLAPWHPAVRSPESLARGPRMPGMRAHALTPRVLILAVYVRFDGWEGPIPLRFSFCKNNPQFSGNRTRRPSVLRAGPCNLVD
jgi:hypothetical protein